MKIKIRRKANKNGTTTLYLDVYKEGKRSYYFPGLALIPVRKPSDRIQNKETEELAQKIRTQMEYEAIHSANGLPSPSKGRVDFLAYFDSYIQSYKHKDVRMFKAAQKQMATFLNPVEGATPRLPIKQVNEAFLQKFRDYLEEHFTGETPHDYFSKVKQVIGKAVKEGHFRTDPSAKIKNSRGNNRVKDTLTFEELDMLAGAPTNAPEIKRAFLFCCMTGLRWCDAKSLQWKSIRNDQLKIVQQKTGIPLELYLHPTAQALLQERGRSEDLVFLLPSSTAANKALQGMVDRAGIEKKITWHCARHTFGTNLFCYDADIMSASKLLGHSSLTYTQRYVRVAEHMKLRAIQKLPSILLPIGRDTKTA